jgi:hypothetical protein
MKHSITRQLFNPVWEGWLIRRKVVIRVRAERNKEQEKKSFIVTFRVLPYDWIIRLFLKIAELCKMFVGRPTQSQLFESNKIIRGSVKTFLITNNSYTF